MTFLRIVIPLYLLLFDPLFRIVLSGTVARCHWHGPNGRLAATEVGTSSVICSVSVKPRSVSVIDSTRPLQ
jgi:hypothetical protein